MITDSQNLSIVAINRSENDPDYVSDVNSDFVATVVTFVLGSIGNMFAILALFKSLREQRKSVFYILVACLVTMDLFGLVTSSTLLIGIHTQTFSLQTFTLCQLFSFTTVFTRLSTLMIIGAMAVDRHLSLHSSYNYNRIFHHTHAIKLVIGIMLLALAFALMPMIGIGQYVQQYPGTWCFFCRYSRNDKDAVYAYLFSSLGLLVILLLLFCNVSAIWTLLKAHFRHRRQSFQGTRRTSTNENTLQRKEQHREIQMAVLLAGIALTFTTCWGPILVRTIFTTFHNAESCNDNDVHTVTPDRRTDMFLIHLASFNQVIDPWVYILLRKECLSRGMRLIRYLFCRGRLAAAQQQKQSVITTQLVNQQVSPLQQFYRRQSSFDSWRRARSASAMSEDMRGRRKSRLSERYHSTTPEFNPQRRASSVYLCPCCRWFPLPQYVLGMRKQSNFSYFSTARPSTVTVTNLDRLDGMDTDTDSMTATVFQVNGRRMTVDQQSAILVAISEKEVGQSSDIEEEGEVNDV